MDEQQEIFVRPIKVNCSKYLTELKSVVPSLFKYAMVYVLLVPFL